MAIKMAVVGSRSVTDERGIFKYLDRCVEKAKEELILVSGGAKGVDTIARNFAKSRGLVIIEVIPAWNKGGSFHPAAGYERNHIIWEIADCGIAFWDRVSKGTAHSFDIAKQLNKKLVIVECDKLPW